MRNPNEGGFLFFEKNKFRLINILSEQHSGLSFPILNQFCVLIGGATEFHDSAVPVLAESVGMITILLSLDKTAEILGGHIDKTRK